MATAETASKTQATSTTISIHFFSSLKQPGGGGRVEAWRQLIPTKPLAKKKPRKRITDTHINAWAFHALTVQLAKITIGGNHDLAQ